MFANGQRPEQDRSIAVECYMYPAGPELQVPDWLTGDDGPGNREQDAATPDNRIPAEELDRRLAEETERSFAAGRVRGLAEGRDAERNVQDQRLQQELVGLVASFAAERDRYLRCVEEEVVKLSLAIAARVLRREAQTDPLLLTGAVRVALGQLSASTQVRLKIPAAQLDLWTDAIGLLPNLSLKPEIIAQEDMRIGDCVVETELGAADLGVRAQFAEIERGFFDATSRSTSNTPPLEQSV